MPIGLEKIQDQLTFRWLPSSGEILNHKFGLPITEPGLKPVTVTKQFGEAPQITNFTVLMTEVCRDLNSWLLGSFIFVLKSKFCRTTSKNKQSAVAGSHSKGSEKLF